MGTECPRAQTEKPRTPQCQSSSAAFPSHADVRSPAGVHREGQHSPLFLSCGLCCLGGSTPTKPRRGCSPIVQFTRSKLRGLGTHLPNRPREGELGHGLYSRGDVQLIVTGGPTSLVVAFRGPMSFWGCVNVTAPQGGARASGLPPGRNQGPGWVKQGGGLDSACGPCVRHLGLQHRLFG